MRYVRMMDMDRHTSLHPFYDMMRTCTNMHHNKSFMSVIRLLSLPSTTYESDKCKLCDKTYTDISTHVITECHLLYEQRNVLWDRLLDRLDVNTNVNLSSIEDSLFTDICFGKKWNGFRNVQDVEALYADVATILSQNFIIGFKSNYNCWIYNITCPFIYIYTCIFTVCINDILL